jgi:hypothetical protein
MKGDDVLTFLIAVVFAGSLSATLGFGFGLLALDGFLKSIGLGILFGFGGTLFMAAFLLFVRPWER